jgi:serine protease inhibitor
MIQKTKVIVDEKGSSPFKFFVPQEPAPIKFNANRPFLFFIVDKYNNLILFSGQYVDPELY